MFLRNAWYVACWKADLGSTPKARTILGEAVVLFRGPDGKLNLRPQNLIIFL